MANLFREAETTSLLMDHAVHCEACRMVMASLVVVVVIHPAAVSATTVKRNLCAYGKRVLRELKGN